MPRHTPVHLPLFAALDVQQALERAGDVVQVLEADARRRAMALESTQEGDAATRLARLADTLADARIVMLDAISGALSHLRAEGDEELATG